MNKTIWQTILKNLKVTHDHIIILTSKKLKGEALNSAMALIKGKEHCTKKFSLKKRNP